MLYARNRLPWVSTNLLQLMRKRNCFLRKYNRSKKTEHFVRYKFIRNCVTSEMQKAKKAHLSQMSSSNPKCFRKLYKVITKKESSISSLSSPESEESEVLVSNSLEKAHLLHHLTSNYHLMGIVASVLVVLNFLGLPNTTLAG